MKLVALALVSLLALPSLAAADDGPRGDRRPMRRALLERFDANGDGQLQPEERMQAKRAKRQAVLQRFDANRDGQLQPQERKQAKRVMRAKRVQRFIQRFDTNRDGNVGPGEVPPEAAMRLRKLDRDGDGWVRPDELRGSQRQRR